MKDFEYEKVNNLSLADGADDEYDEYEEESTERDEYVDGEEEYYDEEQPEEEYYDEEEPYEEEELYEEEEPYEEEESYDDGYDNQYYDDRLNKVLDELADLKRGMVPATVNQPTQQPIYSQAMPSVPYVYTNNVPNHQGGNEVVMYNEISRLRDELSKTQNSQTMHVELSKLKDEMTKENKQSESQFLNEIKRLNDKIELLQKNEVGPQGEDRYYSDDDVSEGQIINRAEMNKLISINEAILKNAKSVDSKIQSEISQIKTQLSALPNFDEMNKVLGSLRNSLKDFRFPDDSGINNKLLSEITSLKDSIKQDLSNISASETGGFLKNSDNKILEKIEELKISLKVENSDFTEILRQLYDLKNVIGSSSPNDFKHNSEVLNLYNELNKVKYDINSKVLSIAEKLQSLYNFQNKLSESKESDINEIHEAFLTILNKLMNFSLTKESYNSLSDFANINQIVISNNKKESVVKFLSLANKVLKEGSSSDHAIINELIEYKNIIQNYQYESVNEELSTNILNINAELMFATDDSKIKQCSENLKIQLNELATLNLSDVFTFPLASITRVYKISKSAEKQALFDKINELKNVLLNLNVSAQDGNNASATVNNESLASNSLVLSEIDSLKNELFNLTNTEDISRSIQELKSDYMNLLSKLTEISEDIQAIAFKPEDLMGEKEEGNDIQFTNNEISSQVHDIRDEVLLNIHEDSSNVLDTMDLKFQEFETSISENLNAALVADLELIKTKLNDQDLFISQIGDLRADILSIPLPIDITPHLDKLYEDLSTYLNSIENNIVGRVSDSLINALATSDSTIAAKIDEMQTTTTETGLNLADSINILSANFDEFNLRNLENLEITSNDRTKILDDLSFIRQQIESEQLEMDKVVVEDEEVVVDELTIYTELLDIRDRLYADIDNIQEKVVNLELSDNQAQQVDIKNYDKIFSELTSIKEQLELKSLETNLNDETQLDSKNNVLVELATVKDMLQVLSAQEEDKNVVIDSLTELKEKNNALEVAISDNFMLTSNAQQAILEEVQAIRAKLEVTENIKTSELPNTYASDEIIDQLNVITEKLHTEETSESDTVILDDLTFLREKIETIEKNDLTDKQTLLEELASIKSKFDEKDVLNQLDRQLILDELTTIKEQVLPKEELSNSSEIMLEDLAVLREKIEAMEQNDFTDKQEILDELTFIKSKFEENQVLTFSDKQVVLDELSYIKLQLEPKEIIDNTPEILDELTNVLNKLEVIEQSSIIDKQLIMDDLTYLKQQIETKELESGLSAIAASDDDRNTLISELTSIKDSLNSNELEIKTVSDNSLSQMSLIMDEIIAIKDKLNVSEKSNDIDLNKIQDDLSFIRNQIEVNMEDFSDANETSVDTIPNEEINLILDELTTIKEKLQSEDEYELLAEILSLREEIKAARIVDQNDVSSELEAVKNELLEFKNNGIIDEIRGLRDEVSAYREDFALAQEETSKKEPINPTNDEVNMFLNEIVSLRDEVQSYKDEMNTILNSRDNIEQVPEQIISTEENENITIILDEITSLRSELQGFKDDAQNEQATELEAKLSPVISDIDSLKESIYELKDIISRRTTLVENAEGTQSEELNVVLDEIINLKDGITEVKEHLTLADERETANSASEEKSFMEEIRSFKDDIIELLSVKNETSNSEINDLTTTIQALQNQITDMQLNQALNTYSSTNSTTEYLNSGTYVNDIEFIKNELASVKDSISTTVNQENYSEQENPDKNYQNILDEIAVIKDSLATSANSSAYEADINVLTEVLTLHDELAAIKDSLANGLTVSNDSGEYVATNFHSDLIELKEQLTNEIISLKEQYLNSNNNNDVYEQDLSVMTEVMSLREEIASLKEQIIGGITVQPLAQDNEQDLSVMNEVMSLREEIASLKEQITSGITVQPLAQDNEQDLSVMTEVMSLREEISELKNSFSSNKSKSSDELEQSIVTIKEDIKSILDEPDFGVLNEILALRDEFQNMKDQLGKSSTLLEKKTEELSKSEDKSNDEILIEVHSLRDQLFAISMANINDGTDKAVYESYNNIILDEISALRDEIGIIKNSEAVKAVMEEISQIKDSIANTSVDDRETIMNQLSQLKNDLELMKKSEINAATNNTILIELNNLKQEMSNQRDADVTTLNFMAEMAHLLERQNLYINQSSNSKMSGEFESLKAEIASTLVAAPQSLETSAIMSEIAKLKEELSQNAGESVVIDNQAIVDELVKLKEELSKEKPSQENNLILQEISRLKDEVSAIAEKESFNEKNIEANDTTQLSKSINDLKNELNQIADFVNETEEKTAAKNKSGANSTKSYGTKTTSKASSSKSAAKTTAVTGANNRPSAKKTNSSATKKSDSINKSNENKDQSAGTKKQQIDNSKLKTPIKKNTKTKSKILIDNNVDTHGVSDEMSSDELLSKIEATSIEIPRNKEYNNQEEFNPNLNANYTPITHTNDDLDLASKLAKQVANKLIMEQLVQQLGDGGVPRSTVEEIVKDILPQEFSTVQLDEQSDQVKRLANSLVLDKLRARLTGKK